MDMIGVNKGVTPPLVGICNHRCSKPLGPLTGLTFNNISIVKSDIKKLTPLLIEIFDHRYTKP